MFSRILKRSSKFPDFPPFDRLLRRIESRYDVDDVVSVDVDVDAVVVVVGVVVVVDVEQEAGITTGMTDCGETIDRIRNLEATFIRRKIRRQRLGQEQGRQRREQQRQEQKR